MNDHYNKDEVASGFQNFLICVEMFFAALAHTYAFPPRNYMDPGCAIKSGLVYSLKIMFNVRDVVEDGAWLPSVHQLRARHPCVLRTRNTSGNQTDCTSRAAQQAYSDN